MQSNTVLNEITFTRVNQDINGNPRYVCHFLNLLSEKEKEDNDGPMGSKYALAVKKAKALGGRKFHNKQYGGGIVFQAYEGELRLLSERIKELSK